jgi:hypothetical protein
MSGLVTRIGAWAVITVVSSPSPTDGAAGSAVDWGLLQPTPNFLDSYTRGFDQGRRIAADRAAARAARDTEQQRRVRAQAAGRMIADGKCQDARSYALLEGDLDLALQVARLCPYAP